MNAMIESMPLKKYFFDSSISGNSVATLDGIITDVNSAFLRLWAYQCRETVIGKSIHEFFNDPNEASEIVLALRNCGQWKGTFNAKKRDGTKFLATAWATVVRDENGVQIGFQSLVIDVSDLKLIKAEEEKISGHKHQLQKADSLNRMAGAIAHHFNNHLQAVMMNLDLAIKILPIIEKTSESADLISQAMISAHKAAEVSKQMLTYLGQRQCDHMNLDFSEVCRDCLQQLELSLPKNFVVCLDLPFPGPVIQANFGQIKQILTNIITNAWEASNRDYSMINLKVYSTPAEEISNFNRFPLDCKLDHHKYACLEVADAGCGIPDDDIKNIFDPFFSKKFVGRGMGLAEVIGIVRAHRGAVTVESQPNRGSVFRVYFPLLEKPNISKTTDCQQSLHFLTGATVLLVEDDEILREISVTGLSRSGATVIASENGFEALKYFQQHKKDINCVVTDLTLPGMNGWEILHEIRKQSPGIPVLLTSGYNIEHVMKGDRSELPQAFLSKPYSIETLCENVLQLINDTHNSENSFDHPIA